MAKQNNKLITNNLIKIYSCKIQETNCEKK